jgi:hypothetical protein
MVCFGQNQWLWKCPSRHTTEDGLTDGAPLVNNGLIQWAHLIGKGSIDTKKDYLNYWYQMVTNYSSRSLTYESDKGNAIAGLTNIFTKKTGFRYLAGLWEEDLANGLSWQASARGVVREPTSIASWSWLSVKGRILGCRYKAPPVPMIELLEADQQWEGPPLVSRLEAARLTIRGFLLQATLGKVSVTQESRYSIIAALQSEEIFGEAFLDSKLLDNNEELAVLALFLSSREQDGEYMTLLLTPRENTGDGNEYRRLGIGVLWKTSRFYGESRAGCNVLKKASLNTVVLV